MTQPSTAPTQTTRSDPLLADLIEELTGRLHAGEAVDVEAYAAKHPTQAEQLRQLFPALRMLAVAGSSAGAIDPQTQPATVPPPLVTGVLGDYRIIREIGRGGMGIVYEAEQISLKRRVALKVLPFAATLDPRQLQRFHNEAQAAACLQHNHIVPVFAVGCERGVHYYAMQYIEGQSLDSLIQELRRQHGLGGNDPQPTRSTVSAPGDVTTLPRAKFSTEGSTKDLAYIRTAAQLGRQAALALEHAHQQSIVHRDIKPANLLVDHVGSLWITDFGLARSKSDLELTRTGDLLGTLRYMSPEQAQGKPGLLDHRTDIYALGATLYELLTLQPVFDARDRQALLRQISDDEPRPVRRFTKTVPAEFETIILKMLAKHPAERYATAQEVAEDLERFLEDKPIRARRPSLAERTIRWLRRHKLVVAAGIFMLLSAIVALSVSSVFFLRQRDEREARLRKTRAVVDQMTDFAQKWLPHQPHLEPVQEQYLRYALRHYEEFVAEDSGNPALALETGKALHRIADIQHKLGRLKEARGGYERAIGLLEDVFTRSAERTEAASELAACHNDVGNLQRDSEQLAEAEKSFFLARGLYAKLAKDHPGQLAYWEGLAGASINLGTVLAATERPEDAAAAYYHALSLCRKLVADDPASPIYRHDLAGTLNDLANVQRDTGKFQEAEKAYRNALDIWLKLAHEFPDRPVYREALASNYHSAAGLLATMGRLPAAEQTYREALAMREKLAGDYPAVPLYPLAQAVTLDRLGYVLAARGAEAEAERSYRQSLALLKKLVSEQGDSPAYRLELAACENDYGSLLLNLSRFSEAEKTYAQARMLAETLCNQFPDRPRYRWLLGSVYKNQGGVFFAVGRRREAEQAFRQALNLEERLLTEAPHVHRYRAELAWSLATCPVLSLRDGPRALGLATELTGQLPEDGQAWTVLGVAQLGAGDARGAVTALQKAKELTRGESAALGFYLAMAQWQAGARQSARQSYDLGRGLLEKSKTRDRELHALQAEAAVVLGIGK